MINREYGLWLFYTEQKLFDIPPLSALEVEDIWKKYQYCKAMGIDIPPRLNILNHWSNNEVWKVW